jgi:hypothetical protein
MTKDEKKKLFEKTLEKIIREDSDILVALAT